MLIGKPSDIRSSEITRESDYWNRRKVIKTGVAALGGLGMANVIASRAQAQQKLAATPSKYSTTGEAQTSFGDITSYNNYYEFGVEKSDPARNAGKLRTRPWMVKVDGEVAKPRTFDLDSLMKISPLEERVFRFRCVEAWSMVIPWVGFSLSELIKQCEPTSKAKYVQFLSVVDRSVMNGLNQIDIGWPYSEGLRMDEAMNPLTTLAFGLYGQALPNQDGAPVRMVIPWKYGFKGAKSITTIRFVQKQPSTAWNNMAPGEYGFYSNVNPNVDHPRWSQKFERRIGEPFYKQRHATLMFNGYGDQVASLYSGMDLNRYF